MKTRRMKLKFVLGLTALAGMCNFALAALAEEDDKAKQLAALLYNEDRFNAIIDTIVERVSALSQREGMGEEEIARGVEEFQEGRKEIGGMISWDGLVTRLAVRLEERFTEEEIGELLAFYSGGVGQKLLNSQPDLLGDLVEASVGEAVDGVASFRMTRYLAELERGLGKEEGEAVAKAKAAKPFPEELLRGKWYGKELSDPAYPSWWFWEVKAGGILKEGGVFIDVEEKLYDEYEFSGRWMVVGRLLITTDFSTGEHTAYIMDELDQDKLTYRVVDTEFPLAEWEPSTDTHLKIEMPERPEGYKSSEEFE